MIPKLTVNLIGLLSGDKQETIIVNMAHGLTVYLCVQLSVHIAKLAYRACAVCASPVHRETSRN
jgi:hypothetical protein